MNEKATLKYIFKEFNVGETNFNPGFVLTSQPYVVWLFSNYRLRAASFHVGPPYDQELIEGSRKSFTAIAGHLSRFLLHFKIKFYLCSYEEQAFH